MKPGYKTTEFWFAIGVAALGGILSYLQTLEAEWAISAAAAVSVAYSLARRWAKKNPPPPDPPEPPANHEN